MRYNLSTFILIIAVFIFLLPPISAEIGDSSIEIFEVSSKVDCMGAFFTMKCFMVNDSIFYGGITGFEYQEGYIYTLKVNRTQIYNESNLPQDDARMYSYTLMEVLSKERNTDYLVYWVVGGILVLILVIIMAILFRRWLGVRHNL